MAAEVRRFEPLEIPDVSEQSASEKAAASFAANAITLGLKVLSQRAVAALVNLYSILILGSAWYLFLVTLPNPTTPQLVGLGLYGSLVIAVHLIMNRKQV